MLTILYPPTIDWHYLFQRPQQLFTSLAKRGLQMIFCNQDHFLPQSAGIKRLAPNLYLVNRADPYSIPMDGFPLLWITYPPHVHNLKDYRHQAVIFDALDEPSEEFLYWRKDAGEIVSKSDLIIASSQKIVDFYSRFEKPIFLVPNGVDFHHFSHSEAMLEPFDLKKIHRPRICFSGALAQWVDWSLVREVARICPDFSFVFIGPALGKMQLPKEDNLFYLGLKPYRQLPVYLKFSDVLIIPFRVSAMTEACNPIKLWEYLASGKPIVSTGLPEVDQLKLIGIGDDPFSFSAELHKALTDVDPIARNKRRELARINSWDQRAQSIVALIKQTKKLSGDFGG